MDTPDLAAGWLLAAAVPIGLWVAWSDLARMKIPNRAVLALIIAFGVIGPFVLPFGDYAWRWAHLGVMLVIGIVVNAAGLMGAGDAKFIAAAAPFVALGDAGAILYILAGTAMLGYGTHRLVRATVGPRLAPGWISWTSGNRFPMGYPLAAALIVYLVLAAA